MMIMEPHNNIMNALLVVVVLYPLLEAIGFLMESIIISIMNHDHYNKYNNCVGTTLRIYTWHRFHLSWNENCSSCNVVGSIVNFFTFS